MSVVTLVTGGVRSGKSAHAEALARAAGDAVLYLATGVALDEEMVQRIARHQAARPATWRTWERYRHLGEIGDVAADCGAVILDCLGNLLGGIWFDEEPTGNSDDLDEFARIEALACAEVDQVIDYCRATAKDLVIVTNEIGWGVVPETRLGRYFRDALGRVNRHVAARADRVVLLVCGIPVPVKG
jgi:adenosylcobinamide kinase/adenosylcobinamide-phosphate guanylyltransferase